jgi:hypothetical protein
MSSRIKSDFTGLSGNQPTLIDGFMSRGLRALTAALRKQGQTGRLNGKSFGACCAPHGAAAAHFIMTTRVASSFLGDLNGWKIDRAIKQPFAPSAPAHHSPSRALRFDGPGAVGTFLRRAPDWRTKTNKCAKKPRLHRAKRPCSAIQSAAAGDPRCQPRKEYTSGHSCNLIVTFKNNRWNWQKIM